MPNNRLPNILTGVSSSTIMMDEPVNLIPERIYSTLFSTPRERVMPNISIPTEDIPEWEDIISLAEANEYEGDYSTPAGFLDGWMIREVARQLLPAIEQLRPKIVEPWDKRLAKVRRLMIEDKRFQITTHLNQREDKQLVIDVIEELMNRNDQLQSLLNNLRTTTK